ncbi:HAD-IIA family hydrolase [Pseudonocardiaceae bacterium YIM PH 21723]|nr:HAD-IIA family hydrolase [Pseudonocardiaceae bacterium YIM PH 21723]
MAVLRRLVAGRWHHQEEDHRRPGAGHQRLPARPVIAARYDGFIVDLDGVVHLGWSALPGAVSTVNTLLDTGKRILFLTNDPRFTRRSIADRLRGLGIPATPDMVITSGSAGAARVAPGRVYVIGSAELKDEVRAAGGEVLSDVDAHLADRVLVAGHSGFDYTELRAALRACSAGAELVATNRDATFPMPDGLWPATGAVLAAVETAAGRRAVSVGKPSPEIFRVAVDLLAVPRIAVIGDREDTDIAGGRAAGLDTILIGSGESHADHIIPALSGVL